MTCHVQDCGRVAVWRALSGNVELLVCQRCADAARELGMAVRAVPAP